MHLISKFSGIIFREREREREIESKKKRVRDRDIYIYRRVWFEKCISTILLVSRTLLRSSVVSTQLKTI